jgi:hypothetical protein
MNLETLGFHVKNTPLPAPNATWTPHDYFAGLFGCVIRQQESDLENRALDRARTVSVPDDGVPLTDFSIDRQAKLALVEAGRAATEQFLCQRSQDRSETSTLANQGMEAGSRNAEPAPEVQHDRSR